MESSIKTTSEAEERICTSLNGIDYMICLSHLFLALNSSMNVVIYAWRGKYILTYFLFLLNGVVFNSSY